MNELLKRLAYVVANIDRAGVMRADAARIAELRQSGRARFLPVWRQRQPFEIGADGTPNPIILNSADADADAVFLGLVDETPWFAVGLPDADEQRDDKSADYRVLNEFVARLPAEQASLLAYARGMVIWHSNHKHCGRCGAAARATEAGHSRTCTNATCGHRSFPRTDPVVIVAIVHPDGEHVLLGRGKAWPAKFFSAIAGFVEPGETLEQAVMRETMEETNVRVTDVRYMASQPWPFPASIMLGFHARALNADFRCDNDELAECRWFSRAEVRAASDMGETGEGFKLANPFAIARYLIDAWAANSA